MHGAIDEKAELATLSKVDATRVIIDMTAVDRKSIMHYSLAPELFKLGRNSKCWVPDNFDLSEQDRRFMGH